MLAGGASLQRIAANQLQRARPACLGKKVRHHIHHVVDADVPVHQIGGGRVERPVDHQRRTLDVSPRHKSPDRKSTRLNSSHLGISYAVFCLKKKKNNHNVSSHLTGAPITPPSTSWQPGL